MRERSSIGAALGVRDGEVRGNRGSLPSAGDGSRAIRLEIEAKRRRRRTRILLGGASAIALALSSAPIAAQEIIDNETASVRGDGIPWIISDYLYVGDSGDATLFIGPNAQVIAPTVRLGNQAGSSGTIIVSGPNASLGGVGLHIGYGGAGVLSISDGGTVTGDGVARIGSQVGSTGTTVVSGEGSTWQTQALYVGDQGSGSLLIENGADVRTQFSTWIGREAAGEATVTGAGSSLSVSSMTIGNRAAGDLTIEDGGAFSASSQLQIGVMARGTVTVAGNASVLSASDIFVGAGGIGDLAVTGSGSATATNTYVGTVSSGSLSVRGAGSSLGSDYLSVGFGNHGSLVIEEGGAVTATNAFIGEYLGGVGSLAVIGTNSSLVVSGSALGIGVLGNGNLTVEAGGAVSSAAGFIGTEAGSNGTARINGAGSSWTNRGGLTVGNIGMGALTVEAGGALSSAAGFIGFASGANGTVSIIGSGSHWDNNAALVVGASGQALLTISDGGHVSAVETLLASEAGGIGNIRLNGSTTGRGVLETGQVVEQLGAGKFAFDGGILRATRDHSDFLSGFEAGDVTLEQGGAFIDSNGYDIGVATALGGTGGLTKEGLGTLTLSGSNTYSGVTTVEAGILRAGSHGALVDKGDYVINGGTLDLNGRLTTSGVDLSMASLSGTGGILELRDASLEVNQSVDTSFDGDVNATTGHFIKSGNGTLMLNGTLHGFDNGFTIAAGTLALNGVNTYSGQTRLFGIGTLEVGNNAALGTGRLLVDPFSIEGSVLRANKDVTLSNDIHLNSSIMMARLTIDGDHHLTLAGSISDQPGGGRAGHLIKSGEGMLTLAGSNSYTGMTTVNGGTLSVEGSIAESSLLTVNSAAVLAGSGTVGTTIVNGGGILAPGSSIGRLTVAGDLTLTSGAILDYELGAPGASSSAPGISDRIDITGDLDLNGTLNLSQAGLASDGLAGFGYYRLMTYGGHLTGSGLTIGETPFTSVDVYHEIQAGGGNVDLFIDAGEPGDNILQHWQGGDGIWNTTNRQWLNRNGDIPFAWTGNHAVFKSEPGGFGGGIVIVEGSQSFKGLQFVDDGYRLQGSGRLETVSDGAEIRVLADSAEISTEISGLGGITKTERGTLILSGTNTYSGGTTLRGGTLSVSADHHLGSVSGGLSFNGGLLQVRGTGYSGTLRDIDWGEYGGGFDIVESANRFVVDQDLSGAGDLIKRGDGTLVLSGDNTYGDTIVEAGTLIGEAGSISGNLANAGTVVFEQANNASFSGAITGFGSTKGILIKRGAGILTLDASSALDWTVAQGGLEGSASLFAGDIFLDGATTSLTFTDSGSATYAGAISGTGQLSVHGTGAVVLTGDSSGFRGNTQIKEGALLVSGSGGRLGGSVDVLAGGTLGGSGTIGSGAGSRVSIASGGTLEPGNSIGTLSVDGDLTFDAGSRFEVEVDPDRAAADLVHVSGNTILRGGSVVHVGARGDYDLRSTYTILSTGSLSGEFNTISSNFAFLTPVLHYDYGLGMINLELLRSDLSFAAAGMTRNQIATARGIESIGFGAGNPVYDAVAQLPDDDKLIRASFDALSGEIHASAKAALIEDSRHVRNAINERIRSAFEHAGASRAPVLAYGPDGPVLSPATSELGLAIWSTAFGSWGSTGSDGNAAGLDRSTGGLVAGIDGLVGDRWRLGLMAGYSHSSFQRDDGIASASSDNYHLGVYGGTEWGAVALRSGLAYSRHRIDTNRSAVFPGFADSLSADYDAGTFQAFGELGYAMNAGVHALEPFVNLAYISLDTERYEENGGAAALSGGESSIDASFTTLGVRASADFTLGSVMGRARGMVGWRHAFGDTQPVGAHIFTGSDVFTIAGAPIASNAALIELALDFDVSAKTKFGLSYQGQLAGDTQDHGFNAQLDIRF